MQGFQCSLEDKRIRDVLSYLHSCHSVIFWIKRSSQPDAELAIVFHLLLVKLNSSVRYESPVTAVHEIIF